MLLGFISALHFLFAARSAGSLAEGKVACVLLVAGCVRVCLCTECERFCCVFGGFLSSGGRWGWSVWRCYCQIWSCVAEELGFWKVLIWSENVGILEVFLFLVCFGSCDQFVRSFLKRC